MHHIQTIGSPFRKPNSTRCARPLSECVHMGGGSSNDLMWSIAGVVIRDPRTPYAASMRALREFDAKLLKPRRVS